MRPTNSFGWFLLAFRKYAQFRGRSQRREFWNFQLIVLLAGIVTRKLDAVLGTTPLLNSLFSLAILLPSVGVCVRRLHDIDRSGWWALLPIVNIVFWVKDSDPSENRFGPCPKSAAEMQGAAAGKPALGLGSVDYTRRR